MPRTQKAVARHRRIRRILKEAKGYYGGRSRLLRPARDTVVRAKVYAYRDRRARKRDFRKLWIIRITAACRALSPSRQCLPYSPSTLGAGGDRNHE